jgi:glycosyltransferase involved in cell wall biosynthesis
MYHHRGLDVLLNAAPKIIRINPKIKFILFGSGPELEKLKEFTQKNNLSDNVKFEGWVDRNKIPDYLSEANIGIGPLRSTEVTKGALPIKVLEYMASSLPIIAIKNTLPEDILKNNENGFSVKDENELVDKILFLISNKNIREKMGEKSKEMILKFDWNNVSNSIIDEYKKIS